MSPTARASLFQPCHSRPSPLVVIFLRRRRGCTRCLGPWSSPMHGLRAQLRPLTYMPTNAHPPTLRKGPHDLDASPQAGRLGPVRAPAGVEQFRRGSTLESRIFFSPPQGYSVFQVPGPCEVALASRSSSSRVNGVVPTLVMAGNMTDLPTGSRAFACSEGRSPHLLDRLPMLDQRCTDTSSGC